MPLGFWADEMLQPVFQAGFTIRSIPGCLGIKSIRIAAIREPAVEVQLA